jgi:CheY-like chemotaxis protein
MSKTKTRIMIVEDDTIVAKDLEESLLSLGYEILASTDTGEDAIKEAEKHKPDLILMDPAGDLSYRILG